MTLRHRLDLLSARARPVPTGANVEDAYAKMCAVFERYAPIPAGVSYASGYDRLDAVLDRLAAAGWTIPERAGHSRVQRIAAALGWTVTEYRAALQARMRGEAW